MVTVPGFLSYVRNKHLGIEELEESEGVYFKLSSSIEDTFFAGEVVLMVRLPELEITSVTGQIKRSFNKECHQAIPILQKLVGLRIGPGLTKRVDGLIGAVDGCTNMANLVLESCYWAVFNVRRYMRRQSQARGLSRTESQQLMLQQFPGLVHQCIVWSTANIQVETPRDGAAVLPMRRLKGEAEMLTFSVNKFVGVGRLDKDTFWVQSAVSTMAHNFIVEMQVRLPHFEITSVQGEMRRSPGEVCREGIPHLQNAVGVRIERGLTAVIDEKVGRPGCPRLANLVLEGCHAVLQGTVTTLLEDCEEEGQVPNEDEFKKRWLESMPLMENTCLAYCDASPLIQRLGIKWK